MLEKITSTFYISDKKFTTLYVPNNDFFRIFILTTKSFKEYLRYRKKNLEDLMIRNDIPTHFILISQSFIQKYCADYSAGSKLNLVNIEICDSCNFNCLHCYYCEKNEGNVLSLERYNQILLELSHYDEINIRISGGEPTLNPDIVDICKLTMMKPAIKEHTIITNASAPLQVLKDILATGIKMQISIYGFSEESYRLFTHCATGTFSEIKEKLILLTEKEKEQIILIFYDTLITHKDIAEFRIFAHKFHFSFKISGYSIIGNAKLHKDKIELKNHEIIESIQDEKDYSQITLGCKICHLNRINIEINGGITPCPFFHDGNEEFLFGQIFSTKIPNIFNSQKFRSFKNLTVDNIENCRSCSLKYVCTAGCCGETYSVMGSILKQYPRCQKEVMIKNIKHNKIYQIKKYTPGLMEANEID